MVNLYLTYLEWCSEHIGELSHIMTRKEFEALIYNKDDECCSGTTNHKDEKDCTTKRYYCDTESYN